MKVKEVIKELKTLPKDYEVLFYSTHEGDYINNPTVIIKEEKVLIGD